MKRNGTSRSRRCRNKVVGRRPSGRPRRKHGNRNRLADLYYRGPRRNQTQQVDRYRALRGRLRDIFVGAVDKQTGREHGTDGACTLESCRGRALTQFEELKYWIKKRWPRPPYKP